MTDLDKLIEAVEAGEDAPWILTPFELRDYVETIGFAFGGSLDAAKALHEALLPGWLIHDFSNTSRSMGWCMVICSPWGVYETSHHGSPDMRLTSPARAWLIAILKAHRSKVQTNG